MEMAPSLPSRCDNGDAQTTVPSAEMSELPELFRSLQPGLGPTTFTALPAAMKFAYSTLASPRGLFRAQELSESRGGRPGLSVPNIPYDLCGRKATLNSN